MGNPIINLLGRTNPAMQALSQMVGIAKTVQNPQAALQQMSANNPQMQEVMQLINQNGGINNAQNIFYNLCQQRGVDPNTILNQLRSM